MPLSYFQLNEKYRFFWNGIAYSKCVVWLKFSSWSMRNGNPPAAPGVAPTPPTCGLKNRAATEDIVTRAEKPFTGVSVPLIANPGIFELCHSIGNVIGVAPSTLKSYPLCVYFQIYSAFSTKCFV